MAASMLCRVALLVAALLAVVSWSAGQQSPSLDPAKRDEICSRYIKQLPDLLRNANLTVLDEIDELIEEHRGQLSNRGWIGNALGSVFNWGFKNFFPW